MSLLYICRLGERLSQSRFVCGRAVLHSRAASERRGQSRGCGGEVAACSWPRSALLPGGRRAPWSRGCVSSGILLSGQLSEARPGPPPGSGLLAPPGACPACSWPAPLPSFPPQPPSRRGRGGRRVPRVAAVLPPGLCATAGTFSGLVAVAPGVVHEHAGRAAETLREGHGPSVFSRGLTPGLQQVVKVFH